MDEDDKKRVINEMEKKIYGHQDRYAVLIAKEESDE